MKVAEQEAKAAEAAYLEKYPATKEQRQDLARMIGTWITYGQRRAAALYET